MRMRFRPEKVHIAFGQRNQVSHLLVRSIRAGLIDPSASRRRTRERYRSLEVMKSDWYYKDEHLIWMQLENLVSFANVTRGPEGHSVTIRMLSEKKFAGFITQQNVRRRIWLKSWTLQCIMYVVFWSEVERIS